MRTKRNSAVIIIGVLMLTMLISARITLANGCTGTLLKTWNHNVFGGHVRFVSYDKKIRCSAVFDRKGTEQRVESGYPYFESQAQLSCDIYVGGYLVVVINKQPTGFTIPPGAVPSDTHVTTFVSIREMPEVSVYMVSRDDYEKKVERPNAIVLQLFPIARNKRCEVNPLINSMLIDGGETYKHMGAKMLDSYLQQHPVGCEPPYWYQ